MTNKNDEWCAVGEEEKNAFLRLDWFSTDNITTCMVRCLRVNQNEGINGGLFGGIIIGRRACVDDCWL
jgi:hypothetical protein